MSGESGSFDCKGLEKQVTLCAFKQALSSTATIIARPVSILGTTINGWRVRIKIIMYEKSRIFKYCTADSVCDNSLVCWSDLYRHVFQSSAYSNICYVGSAFYRNLQRKELVINNIWIMKTKDELEKLEKEELISMVMQLQSNCDVWYNASQRSDKRLEAVKSAVKSIVLFIE